MMNWTAKGVSFVKRMFSKVTSSDCSIYVLICIVPLYFQSVKPCEINTYNSSSGILYSINYPEDYPNNLKCITVIEIPNAFYIEIVFDKLHTEALSDLNLKGDLCKLDYVEIIVDGNLHRLCGNWNKKEHFLYFKFKTDKAEIVFVSDERVTNEGFVIKWDAVQIDKNSTRECAPAYIDTADSCFEIITEARNWADGNQECKSKGALLATIDAYETHLAIEKELLARNFEFETFWIGASDRLFEGDFRWPDRTAVTFHNWFPGWTHLNRSSHQPSDDGFSNEDCVELRRHFNYPEKDTDFTDSYYWNDRDCNAENPFICQYLKDPDRGNFSYIPVECDAFYNLTEKQPYITVTSPMYPDAYPELVSCHMIVVAPFGKQVFVEFSFFSLEDSESCQYDNLTLSAFPATSGVTYCGDWNQKLKKLRWTSDDNSLLLSFITDHSNNFSGFKATIGYTDFDYRCSMPEANLTDISWVYGPGGCWGYANDTADAETAIATCEYMDGIVPTTIDRGQAVFVSNLLKQNRLKMNEDCSTFWMLSAETANFTSSPNRTECLSQTICVSDSRMHLFPEYNFTVTLNACSEMLNFLCLRPLPGSEMVDHVSLLRQPEGDIFSPGFANERYSDSYYHKYVFSAPENHSVFILVKYLDLEYQTKCLYDSLKTIGMTKDRTLCGNLTEVKSFMSASNSCSIIFNTDYSISSGGFHISWYWINKTLPVYFHLETYMTGSITSLNYPFSFPEPVKGCMSISAPTYHRILIEFRTINLPGIGCNDSQIDLAYEKHVLKSFCGNSNINKMAVFEGTLMSLGGSLNICVNLPHLRNNEGFVGSFHFVPRSHVKVDSSVWLAPNETRTITSLMYPLFAPENVFQEAIVETDIGYNIVLKDTEVEIPEGINCTDHFLQVIDHSLMNDNTEVLRLFTCANVTNKTEAIVLQTDRLKTYLNVMKIVLKSAAEVNNVTLKFSSTLVSVMDPLYLNKTQYISGKFKGCVTNTCGDFGECTPVGQDRFTCTCHPHYAECLIVNLKRIKMINGCLDSFAK